MCLFTKFREQDLYAENDRDVKLNKLANQVETKSKNVIIHSHNMIRDNIHKHKRNSNNKCR